MASDSSINSTSASSKSPSGLARDQGYVALEGLGRMLLYGPMIGLLFTSLWSVGIALLTVVMPLTWLTFGGQVPVWMRANPEKLID